MMFADVIIIVFFGPLTLRYPNVAQTVPENIDLQHSITLYVSPPSNKQIGLDRSYFVYLEFQLRPPFS